MKITNIPMEELAQLLQLQMSSGGLARLVVTGNSMYPTLRHQKDAVFLSPVTAPLKKGDLILYKRADGQYILHRIVTKPKNGAFICSGDNQWEPESVEESQVLAVVEQMIRRGKRHNTQKLGYRLWVSCWVFLFPVRRPLLKLRRFLGKIRRKM